MFSVVVIFTLTDSQWYSGGTSKNYIHHTNCWTRLLLLPVNAPPLPLTWWFCFTLRLVLPCRSCYYCLLHEHTSTITITITSKQYSRHQSAINIVAVRVIDRVLIATAPRLAFGTRGILLRKFQVFTCGTAIEIIKKNL